MTDLKIDWCSHEAAKYAVKHWHYSRSLPAAGRVNIGVWEDGQFKGCVIFSKGACPNYHRSFGINNLYVCELTRVALRKHKTPVTKIIRIALKMLKKKCPKMRLVISFADAKEGHIGKIYQAGNWIYVGQTADRTPLYFFRGRWMHPRQVGSLGFSVKGWPEELIKRVPAKFKYLMPLDQEMRNKIMEIGIVKPYPKEISVNSVTSNIAGVHPEDPGASPRLTLQTR